MQNSPTSIHSKRQRPPIRVRRLKFPFHKIESLRFAENNIVMSSFAAALSSVFPAGEEGFIESVRHYQDQIKDPDQKEQVRLFVAQETQHGVQHDSLNKRLEEIGYPVLRLDAHLRAHIEETFAAISPSVRLASTVGMEHITAIMAQYFIEHPELFENGSPEVAELLQWHAVEEIEHKAVAFDVYEQVDGDRDKLRKVYAFTTVEFIFRIAAYQAALMYWTKQVPSLSELALAGSRFLWQKRVVPAAS